MPDVPFQTVIEPSRGWAPVQVAELVRQRELLFFLTWRDVKVRYKQTILGASWAVLQPALTMVVFTLLFGRLAKIPSEGPSPLFYYVGLLPWLYFQNSVTNAGNSLVVNSRLVTKIYFPRVFLPMASTVAPLLDYAIALTLVAVLMMVYGIAPDAELLALPLIMPVGFLAATGVGMFLGALNAQYRDIRYVIPFLLQLWMFLTPVIYPPKLVPERFRWLLPLNPMGGVVDAHRAAILPDKTIDWFSFSVSFGVAAAVFLAGAFYFKRVERSFADLI